MYLKDLDQRNDYEKKILCFKGGKMFANFFV